MSKKKPTKRAMAQNGKKGIAGRSNASPKSSARKSPPKRGKLVRIPPQFRLAVRRIFRLDKKGNRILDGKGGYQTLSLAETRSEELYAYSEATDEFSYVSDGAAIDYGTYVECGIQTVSGNEVASVDVYSIADPVTPVLSYDDPSTPTDPADPTITCDPTTTQGDYEEYGDPDEEPSYDYSDCDGTIGIRA